MAGLAAAESLTRHGLRVQILEARDRIGGRVKSVDTENGDVLPIELGAEFIHGESRETLTRLTSAGMKSIPCSGAYFTSG